MSYGNLDKVTRESVYTEEDDLILVFGDRKYHYPFVWLRDNCLCPLCRNPSTKQRQLTLLELDVDIQVKEYKVADSGEFVEILWSDEHVSDYSLTWLRDRRFTDDITDRRKSYYSLKPITWSAEMVAHVPCFTYHELLTDDCRLYNWLCDLEIHGIAKIVDTPQKPGELAHIARRVAYLRKAYCGETFTLKVTVNPDDVGNTQGALNLHTDLSSHANHPGMLMLHCIKQIPMKGGESQFSDGFHAANQLKLCNPEYYNILSTVVLEFFHTGENGGKEFYQMSRHPIFSHDQDGNLDFITYANHARGSYLKVANCETKLFYKALKAFHGLLYNSANAIETKLQPGEVICINNHRVLHGRSGWEIAGDGERHLEGGYIDWDELRSCRRVLQNRFTGTDKNDI